MSSASLLWNPIAMPSSGLIGHWKLDGNGNDSSTQAKNGTETDMSYVAGRLDLAGSFNGTTSKIDIGDQAVYDFGATDNFSVVVWVKTSSTGSVRTIIAKRGITDPQGFVMDKNTTNTVRFRVDNSVGASTTVTTTQTINDNVWHNIIGVRDVSALKLKIYFDGVFSAEATDTTTGATLASVNKLWIGGREDNSTFWNALLDDVRIYNRVLNAYEISQLYAVEIAAVNVGALT